MSSGYSSLEEDAEDFFFTARTSFFRRAPQGKPRTGQQVSGARGGTPDATCLGGESMLAGKEEGAAAEKRLLPLWIPGSCFELVPVGVPECTGGVPGEGRRRKGGEAGRGLAPAFRARWPLRLRLGQPAAGELLWARRRLRATPGVSPAPRNALRAPRRVNGWVLVLAVSWPVQGPVAPLAAWWAV